MWRSLPRVALTRSEALVALKARASREATQPLFVAAIADLKTARTLTLDNDLALQRAQFRFVEQWRLAASVFFGGQGRTLQLAKPAMAARDRLEQGWVRSLGGRGLAFSVSYCARVFRILILSALQPLENL